MVTKSPSKEIRSTCSRSGTVKLPLYGSAWGMIPPSRAGEILELAALQRPLVTPVGVYVGDLANPNGLLGVLLAHG